MNQYKAMCRLNESSGSAYTWVYVTAANPWQAYQMLKAQYGNLLLSGMAVPV